MPISSLSCSGEQPQRISKFLARHGLASRRAAETLVTEVRVSERVWVCEECAVSVSECARE